MHTILKVIPLCLRSQGCCNCNVHLNADRHLSGTFGNVLEGLPNIVTSVFHQLQAGVCCNIFTQLGSHTGHHIQAKHNKNTVPYCCPAIIQDDSHLPKCSRKHLGNRKDLVQKWIQQRCQCVCWYCCWRWLWLTRMLTSEYFYLYKSFQNSSLYNM